MIVDFLLVASTNKAQGTLLLCIYQLRTFSFKKVLNFQLKHIHDAILWRAVFNV